MFVHLLLWYHFLYKLWVFGSIPAQCWKAFGIIFCIFLWRIFQSISDGIFYWFWTKMDPQRRCQEGKKHSFPRRWFLIRLLLGHPGSESIAPELHFGHPGFQKNTPEGHFGCSFLRFYSNLLAGRQLRSDTENIDETIERPMTTGSTLTTQYTHICRT